MRRRTSVGLLIAWPGLLALAACTGPAQPTLSAAPRPALGAPRTTDLPSGLELPIEQADPEAVRPLFERECAVCHGLSGQGDGPRASAFRPPPADLTDAARTRRTALTWLHRSIVEGKGGMPSWGFQFDRRQTWDLAFLTWSMGLGPREGDQARFTAHCAGCHGARDDTANVRLDRASRVAKSFDAELAALAQGPHAPLATVSAAEREAALRWAWTRLYKAAVPGASTPTP